MNEGVPLWQNYHKLLRHNFLKTYNMENKTIKTKPLPLLLFHVKILLHRPEATWGFLNPESISCSQAFLSPYTIPMQVQLGQWS